MASYELIKNTPLTVYMELDYAQQGWSVSNNIAYHSGCNPGYIRRSFNLSTANLWTFRYEILSLDSGTVNIVVDGVNGLVRNVPGIYQESFVVNDIDTVVQFYSTGICAIKVVQIFPPDQYSNGTTFGFNEDENKWASYFSWKPELMCKFLNSFFSFENGRLWEHNVNEVRNNFYGVQYTSQIRFYCNINPTQIKNFHSLRVLSNKSWEVPEIRIDAYYGKPNGQESRLKKGRFRNLQGAWFADFLKDMNDPRFISQLDALLKGADLQGEVMEVTIENEDTSEVRLTSIDFVVSLSNYSY